MVAFSSIIGQKKALELLERAVICQRIAPAYLFTGPSGVGRRLAAQEFSELLICGALPHQNRLLAQKQLRSGNHPDLFWVESLYLHQGKYLTAVEATAAGLKRKAPPQIRVEQIREITRFLSRPPLAAPRSVVVIEDAHRMAEAAANALLKTLEEPGRGTIILIAPGTDSLLPTLVSRCQQIPFSGLSDAELAQVLQQKGHQEILEHPVAIAIAQGSPGEAIAAYQQLQSLPQDLLSQLLQPPSNPLSALEWAKQIDKLDTQAQLWLVDYLQLHYWNAFRSQNFINSLEQARRCLLNYVQPRLVWETVLLNFYQQSKERSLHQAEG